MEPTKSLNFIDKKLLFDIISDIFAHTFPIFRQQLFQMIMLYCALRQCDSNDCNEYHCSTSYYICTYTSCTILFTHKISHPVVLKKNRIDDLLICPPVVYPHKPWTLYTPTGLTHSTLTDRRPCIHVYLTDRRRPCIPRLLGDRRLQQIGFVVVEREICLLQPLSVVLLGRVGQDCELFVPIRRGLLECFDLIDTPL